MRKSLQAAAAAVIAIVAGISTIDNARADVEVKFSKDDVTGMEFWSVYVDGKHKETWVISYSGQLLWISGGGNPSPDDPSSGRKGDLGALIQLLKQRGGGDGMTTPLADSPLGRLLAHRGQGVVPKHNPGDAMLEGVEGGGGAGGGYVPNGGGIAQQLKGRAGKGGKDKGKGEDGSDLKPGEAGLFEDDMPGPPEIVNPNPVLTPAAGGALVLTGRIGASSDGNGTVVKSGGSAGFGEPDTMSTAGFSQGAPKLPTAAAPRARR